MKRTQFQPAPFLALVIGAQEDRNQRGFIVIEALKMGVETGPGKLGLVIAVVEHPVTPNLIGQALGHLLNKGPALTGEGECNGESLVHAGGATFNPSSALIHIRVGQRCHHDPRYGNL